MSKTVRLKRAATRNLYHHGLILYGEALGVLLAGVLIALFAYLIVSPSIRADYSTFNPGTGNVGVNYSMSQQPVFVVNTDGFHGSLEARVTLQDGRAANVIPTIIKKADRENEYGITLKPGAEMTAGKYQILVALKGENETKTLRQDFTWGVLAMNLDKSSYSPNQPAAIGMAVLDDKGTTLCNSNVKLEITHPGGVRTTLTTADGQIKLSDTCKDKSVTVKPDYYTGFTPKKEGKYRLMLTAETKNGKRSLASEFTVDSSAPYVSERYQTAMRLYPKSSYDVNLRIHARQKFRGTVEERVPQIFGVSNATMEIAATNGKVTTLAPRVDIDGHEKYLRWDNVSLEKGQSAKINYVYQPPNVSPAFYEVGPAKLKPAGTQTAAFEEPRPWQLAFDAAGDVILLWDTANGAIPAGWTCISCSSGQDFYQRFPRANSTYAGTGGGPESITHTYTETNVTGPSATASNTNTLFGSRAIAAPGHTHTFGSPTIGSSDIKPPYKNLQFIRASNPLGLPQNAIAMFDVASTASLPTNWTSYTALNDPGSTGSAGNGVYLRGENTNTTGGTATHTHTRSSVVSGTGGTANVGTNNSKTVANGNHTHTIAAGNTTAEANDPSFITVVFARLTVANDAIPNGMMAFFDNATMPTGWTQQSTIGGNAIADRLVKGSLSAGAVGGRTTHDHGGSDVIVSGGPSTTIGAPNGGLTNTQPATNTHTHTVTYSISAENSMPNYRDVMIGKFATVNYTGTVYSDEGTTPLGSVAVKASINGGAQRQVTAAANGTFTLPMPDPGPGGIVTLWLNTNGGVSGTTVTRSNGGAISGLNIYQNRLIITHEDAGPTSNVNIGGCDKTTGLVCADSDLHFDVSGSNITVDNDWRLYINNGKTYTPGGTVTLSPGGTAVSTGGDLKFGSSGSTFNVSNNAVNVGGDWINTAGGTFSKVSGQTVTMTGTVSGLTLDTSSVNFDRLTFNGSGGAWSFTPAATTVNVDDNFTITAGSVTAPSGTLNIGGNWSNAATLTHNSGTVVLTATTTGKTVNAGSSPFYNLTLNGSGGEWSPLTNTMTLANNLTMTAGTLSNSNGSANVTVNGHVQGTSGVINLTNNTFTHRIPAARNFGTTSGSTNWTFNNLTFSNSSGTSSTVTTQTGGSGTVTVTNTLHVSNTGDTAGTVLNAGNRTWQLTNANGADPFNMDLAGGSLTGSTSTFVYSGDNDAGNVTVENATFNHLTLGGVVTETYVHEGATTVAGNLQITSNATLGGTQNMTVGGSASGTGTVTLTGGTFTNRVSTNQGFGTTSGSNAWTFNHLAFENSSGTPVTVTPNTGGSGTVTTNGTLTIGNASDTTTTTLDHEATDRTLDMNGDLTITTRGSLSASSTVTLTIGGSYNNNGSFAANSGQVTFDSTVAGRTLSGTMIGSNKFNVLTFNGSGGAWSFGGSSGEVAGDLTVTNGIVTGPSTTLTLSGNYANTGSYIHNSGTIVFNAGSSKTINQGSSSPFYNATFNGPGGTWTFQTNAATLNGDLTIVAGTLNNSVNVTVNGSVQCSGTCGTITASNTFTQSVSANRSFGTNVAVGTNWTFNHLTFDASANSPTITFNGTGTGQIVVSGNLTLTKAGGAGGLTVNDTTNNRVIDVNGDVSIALGTTLQAPPSASFTVNGNWANAGTFSHGSGTVTLDSTSSGKTINAGGSSFYNLTLNGSGGVWSPVTNTLSIANDLTMTAGTLGSIADTADILVNGNATGTAGVINVTNASRTFTQRVASGKNFGPTGASNNWTFTNLSFSNSNAGATPVTVTTTSGTGTMTVTGILRIGVSGDASGATTTLDAGNRSWTLSGSGGNPFQLLASPAAGSLSANTSTFAYTGNNGIGSTTVRQATYYKLVINNAAENYFMGGSATVNSDVAVLGGNLFITLNNFTVGSSGVSNSGSIYVAPGATLSQTSNGITSIRSSSGGSATIGGGGSITFYTLRFDPSVASSPTFTLGDGAGQTISITNTFTVGNGTNGVNINANTNDPTLDINSDVTINANGVFNASDTGSFTVAGSWTNNGTFNDNTGTVTFDSGVAGRTINSGGTSSTKDFHKVIFNNGAGGWTIQTSDMRTVSDLTVTAIGTLTLQSGRTLEVGGTYTICDTCTSGTTWTGGTLYLNSGTAYTVGAKSQNQETYGTLQIGTNTDIRTWNSGSSAVVAAASGSLYSQNDSAAVGNLTIYGDYHVTGTDFWQYDTDYDGTSLSGNERQAVVRIETGAGRGVTVDATQTLTIKGGGAGANQFTDIDRIGSGSYQMVNNGTANIQEAKVSNPSFDGGTWTTLNTIVTNQSVTAGALNVDWYMSAHVVDRDDTATNIDTSGQDIAVSETSGSPASTVFKLTGGSWSAGATSQTADSNASGAIAQPNSDGALRVREFAETSGGQTYYKYNIVVAGQSKYAAYDYQRDYGKYLTSVLDTGSPDHQVIGSTWYRDSVSTANAEGTLNGTVPDGTWYAGMSKGVLAFWDTADGSVPTGWSCVSCGGGDPFYQRFLRAAPTYGGTGGGPETLGHHLSSPSAGGGTSFTALSGGTAVASGGHTHAWDFPGGTNTTTDDIKPPYKNLRVIRGPVSGPTAWPANIIMPFNTDTAPTGWSAYTALDGRYIRGESDNATGGSATHTHTTSAHTSGNSSGTTNISTCSSGCSAAASAPHTHTLGGTVLTAANNDPPHITVRFMKHTDTSQPPLRHLIGLFDYTDLPEDYDLISDASPYQNNLLVGAASGIGSTGGSTTHNHGGSVLITSSTTVETTVNATAGAGVSVASGAHTHGVTYTVDTANSVPNYRDVVVSDYLPNVAPDAPASLVQRKTNDTTITTGGWSNETTIEFTADVSDDDLPTQQLQLCIEVKAIGDTLTGTEDSCGAPVDETGSGSVSLLVEASGLSEGQYHWQVRAKDQDGVYSSWVTYGTSDINTRDFGIDTTAPATTAVYDNTNLDAQPFETDAEQNADGSLTTLSASWADFDSTISGLEKYQYSVGTSAGATDVKNWTDNGATRYVRDTGLSLQTGQTYYFNIRAIDNAQNTSPVASTNGIIVTPTLTFDIDIGASNIDTSPPYFIDFGVIDASTVTTSDERIWVDFDTNGVAGGRIYVAGSNVGLKSLAANFTIDSSTGNLASMNYGFGAQAVTASQGSGGPFNYASPYDGAGDVIGALNTTFQSIFTSSNPVTGGRGSFVLKTKISDITPAANDYADVLTIVAAGTY